MTAIVIRKVGPYTITLNDGMLFCNGLRTSMALCSKPLANGAVAMVDTGCKGRNGKQDVVTLQPAQVKTVFDAGRARADALNADYARTHSAEIAALNARQAQATAYDRGMNEGGEGFNPFSAGAEHVGFDEAPV